MENKIPKINFSPDFEHAINQCAIFSKLNEKDQYNWIENTEDKSIGCLYIDKEDMYFTYYSDIYDNFKLYFKKHIGQDRKKIEDFVLKHKILSEINL